MAGGGGRFRTTPQCGRDAGVPLHPPCQAGLSRTVLPALPFLGRQVDGEAKARFAWMRSCSSSGTEPRARLSAPLTLSQSQGAKGAPRMRAACNGPLPPRRSGECPPVILGAQLPRLGRQRPSQAACCAFGGALFPYLATVLLARFKCCPRHMVYSSRPNQEFPLF